MAGISVYCRVKILPVPRFSILRNTVRSVQLKTSPSKPACSYVASWQLSLLRNYYSVMILDPLIEHLHVTPNNQRN